MKSSDFLTAANGGPKWNIFMLALLVFSWLVGQYIAVENFETHVDEVFKGVTKDVNALKGEVVGIRSDMREDAMYINQRIDTLIADRVK